MNNPLALIVEDEINLSKIFSKALQAAHFETHLAHEGNKALESLQTLTPHVILLDLHLPQVSGEQILHYIRTQPRFSKTLIILVTADGNWGESLRQDSDLVLIKPVSPLMLRDLAARLRLTVISDVNP